MQFQVIILKFQMFSNFFFFLFKKVCGPYIALKNYKYKVKLLPGNLTRGKASKLIQSQFIHDAKEHSEKEVTFIKQIPDNLWTEFILGNVKPILQNVEINNGNNFNKKKQGNNKSKK